jgi:hypothetical protein
VRRGRLPWAWSPRPTAEHPYQPPTELSECLAPVAALAQMHVCECFKLLIGHGRLVVERWYIENLSMRLYLACTPTTLASSGSILPAATVSGCAGRQRETYASAPRGSLWARRSTPGVACISSAMHAGVGRFNVVQHGMAYKLISSAPAHRLGSHRPNDAVHVAYGRPGHAVVVGALRISPIEVSA